MTTLCSKRQGEETTKPDQVQIQAIEPGSNFAVTAAGWIVDEWGQLPVVRWLTAPTSDPASLPYVVGAVNGDDTLLGIAALLYDDMPDRDWNPWLGCVFIRASHRRLGLARLLVQHLVHYAGMHELLPLYLFCAPQLEPFYSELGFRTLEERVFEDAVAVTMRLDDLLNQGR